MAKTNVVVEQPQPSAVMIMPWRELGGMLVIGALVGLITYVLYLMFDKYVFTPTLCGDAAANIGRCENKMMLSSGFATIIAALGALFALVRRRTYRPLLIILGVSVGLWGVVATVAGLHWFAAMLLMALMFALGYAAFAWLSLLRNFVISLVLVIALVVVLRILLY